MQRNNLRTSLIIVLPTFFSVKYIGQAAGSSLLQRKFFMLSKLRLHNGPSFESVKTSIELLLSRLCVNV